MIGYTSTGTGVAGIFATGTLLIARATGITNQVLFFVEAPTIIVYYFAFKWLDNKRRLYKFIEEDDQMSDVDLENIAEEDIVQEKTPPPLKRDEDDDRIQSQSVPSSFHVRHDPADQQ